VDKARCIYCDQEVDWVTVEQATQPLGVKEAQVRNLCNAGRLPGAYKVPAVPGRPTYWRIPLSAISAYKRAKEATDE
jgi:hypothetical protein